MTAEVHIPRDSTEFASFVAEIAEVVDCNSGLPNWPFLASSGHVAICQFDHLLGSRFVPVLQELSANYEDENITLVVLKPDASYYWREYSHMPGFSVERDSLSDGYWVGLSHEPNGDATGAIAYSANVVAIVGSSRAWAVWGQRDWEFALVLTDAQAGTWLNAGIPFVTAREALEHLRAPSGWSMAIAKSDRATFLRNFE